MKLGVNPIELLGVLQGQGGAGGLSGAGGLGGLLNGIGGSGGSSSGGGSGSAQAYLNCLKGAQTPVDIQKCAGLK